MKPRSTRVYAVIVVVLLIAIAITTRFNIKGRFEGLFLLKGVQGRLIEVKDDLYLGDGTRLIYGFDFNSIHKLFNRPKTHKPDEAYLEYKWDESDGSGYIKNIMPDGRELDTCFSRFDAEDSENTHGLFVGGGLPDEVHGDNLQAIDETGMAYYDGRRWYHIWCNANEGLASGDPLKDDIYGPSNWKFMGSRVLHQSSWSLALTSSHEAVVDGAPLRIDRYAYFTAGETYFLLSIWIKNIGTTPASYCYVYGDEPWLGDFGSSKGNVGWVSDRLVSYEEFIDPDKYSFAGYFDFGNSAVSPDHNFTMAADFLEWLGDTKPDLVYFSNGPTDYPPKDGTKVPLASNSRFLGLQWGPRVLKPGESDNLRLAVGMATFNPKTGSLIKPEIRLDSGH